MSPGVPLNIAALASAVLATACATTALGGGDPDSGAAADAAAPDAGPGGGPDGAPAGCDGAARCEDFESTATGATPGGVWRVETPSCSGSGTIAVTDAQAHSGARSLEVRGAGGYCNHVFLATDLPADLATVHIRFYLRLDDALGDGHTTFVAFGDANTGKDVRIGGQSRILMWNRESDDATLPELSPAGIAQSVSPAPDQWHCIEATVDTVAGTLRTEIDGAVVPGLVVDGTATPDVDAQWLRDGAWRPDLTDLEVGWESYAGQAMTLWFDDLAISPIPIGC